MAGATARGVNWAATQLGPFEGWPSSLKTTVGTLLHSRQPMFLWWGPELIQFYNDGCLPGIGRNKHPAAMGQPGKECWPEIWPILWPQIDDVMTRGLASWNEDQLVPIFRNDRIEEVYWTYGCSPVFDENGRVGGTLVACTETTARVLAERRLRTLRWLSDATALATDRAAVLQAAAQVLASSPHEAPFALFYEPNATTGAPVLVAHSVPQGPALEELDTAVRLAATKHPEGGLAMIQPEEAALPHRPRPELVRDVFLTPPDPARRGAFFAFGLSPQLPFDGPYRTYLDQFVEHLELAQARIESFRISSGEREHLLTELESASRAKDEFLAMLGHELRNPLAPIVTALQLINMRGGGGFDREHIIIDRQVRHLVHLVDDLLDVAKIAKGKLELIKRTVELGEAIAEAVETAAPLFALRRHHFQVDVPARGLLVDVDEPRLVQIVSNLLTNAARYTLPGGEISLIAVAEGGEVVIRVKDSGIGIEAEILPNIFDLFVQGDRPMDRSDGGLGLGLALVRSLITLHGGSVAARSEGRDRGSEFTVRLPAAAVIKVEPPLPAPPPRPPEQRGGSPQRILLVDDNVDALEMLAVAVRESGHEVEVAIDGPTALAVLDHFTPSVVVLDIGLPVMDGNELAKRIRARPEHRATMLIALTGYGHASARERSREAGFDLHLVKPFEFSRLLSAVEEFSAASRAPSRPPSSGPAT